MDKEKLLDLRRRIISGATAMGIAVCGYGALKPDTAKACEPNSRIEDYCDCQYEEYEQVEPKRTKSKYGVYVDPETEIEYNTVLAEKGDTASKLSSRAIHYYMENGDVPEDYREKYNNDYNTRSECWPVIVYLNTQPGKKYHTVVGKPYIFPKTFDEMIWINNQLRETGWLARYIQNNNIYPKKETFYVPREEVRCLLEEIYRDQYGRCNVVITDVEIDAYLRLHSYGGNFVLKKGSKLSEKEAGILTKWIPSYEELHEFNCGRPRKKVRK